MPRLGDGFPSVRLANVTYLRQPASVDFYVEAAGDALAHVHLQDTDGYADRHWPPGEGNLSWRAIFRALGRLASRPRLIIEVRDQTNIRAGAAYLEMLGLAV